MGRPLIDITGLKFGRLTVISRRGFAHRSSTWNCVCACGRKIIVTKSHLRSGQTQSCGCLRHDLKTKHGHCPWRNASSLYQTWCRMKQKCANPKDPKFPRYGGRGITMCLRWRRSFKAFLDDMGARPTGLQLERKNNNGNYCPSNC